MRVTLGIDSAEIQKRNPTCVVKVKLKKGTRIRPPRDRPIADLLDGSEENFRLRLKNPTCWSEKFEFRGFSGSESRSGFLLMKNNRSRRTSSRWVFFIWPPRSIVLLIIFFYVPPVRMTDSMRNWESCWYNGGWLTATNNSCTITRFTSQQLWHIPFCWKKKSQALFWLFGNHRCHWKPAILS